MDDREATVVETIRQAVEGGQAVSRSRQFKVRQTLLGYRMPGMTASYSHGGPE